MSKKRKYTKQKIEAEKKKELKNEFLIILFASVFFVGLTIFVIGVSYSEYRLWELTHDGVKTKAKIIDINSIPSSGGRGSGGLNFKVKYLYSINEQEYTGKHFGLGEKTWESYKSLKEAKRTHSPVLCYVAKSDNSLAVLNTGLRSLTIFGWVIFPLSFSVCSVILLTRLRSIIKKL